MAPSRTEAVSYTEDYTPEPATNKTKTIQKHGGNRLIHRSFHVEPSMVESAKGLEIHLSNGQIILDACAGAAVAVIGHGNEEVTAALVEQAHKVSYVHTQAFTTPVAEELADIVLEGNTSGLEMAFFVGSGSEAVETAMKMARQYFYEKGETERVHFVGRKQSYHGNTLSTMAVGGNVARKAPYAPCLYSHVSHVTPPYAYRYKKDSETEDVFTARLLRELEDEFLGIGPEKVIAFVAEPVIGATAGCVTPPRGYLKGVRELCSKYGILLILDEIMCGTGRCGTYFAFEQEGVAPDIVTVAKGLGGGYAAISGVLVTGKVIDAIKNGTGAFMHGHTYQAHPLSCATALAVQKIIKRDRLVERCAKMGVLLEQKLRSELKGCKSVGEIRGRGLFWAVEFVKDQSTKETFDPKTSFGVKVQQAAFERGVAIYPGSGTVDGRNGDHVLLAPPFTVTEEQLDTICRVVREAVESQEAKFMS